MLVFTKGFCLNASFMVAVKAIRQNDINLLILHWTLIVLKVKRKIIFFFIELEMDYFFFIFTQNKTFLL